MTLDVVSHDTLSQWLSLYYLQDYPESWLERQLSRPVFVYLCNGFNLFLTILKYFISDVKILMFLILKLKFKIKIKIKRNTQNIYKGNFRLTSIVLLQVRCQLTFPVKGEGTCLAYAIVCISLSSLAPAQSYRTCVDGDFMFCLRFCMTSYIDLKLFGTKK